MVLLQKALHLRSTRTFTDERKKVRKNGEEWLITFNDTEAHIPGIYEEVSLYAYWYLHSIELSITASYCSVYKGTEQYRGETREETLCNLKFHALAIIRQTILYI